MFRRTRCDLHYFKKVLIANRGEIACRVIKTCNRLGIPTVAIYSEPDSLSKHVQLADEAYCVGPAASRDSYLRIDKILEVIKKTGADAVHPGYGFLSENADFSRSLAEHGVTFIGPTESAIHAMGDKIESKKLAKHAGVRTIPGFDGEIQSIDQLLQVANEIGYPIMMKASAGGGGKGMRVAYNDKEAIKGFKLSKSEAAASFGDDRMLVEKFVTEPRHIEIQIIADKNGNVLYLPERECSVQRRNQKVIEEAPSTFLTPEIRQAMGQQAVQLARAVNYHTAGTVEMMVDKDKNFYFLEMNTRLQVEHPVTELIVGLDLVEEMMRAASGENLSVTNQSDVGINGWATECRVYAEDPLNNFLPVVGKLSQYIEPAEPEVPGVRVDSGILEGSEISLFYDPMISKLCVWGPDRNTSIANMLTALDTYVIRGLNRTNINILRDILQHNRYKTGNYTTKFIEEEYPTGYGGYTLTNNDIAELGSVAVFIYSAVQTAQWSNGSSAAVPTTLIVEIPAGETTYKLEVNKNNNMYTTRVLQPENLASSDTVQVQLDTNWAPHEPVLRYSCRVNNGDVETHISQLFCQSKRGMVSTIQFRGTQFNAKVLTPEQAALSEHMIPPPEIDQSKQITSPMPGVVVEVNVKVGDKVEAGTVVVTLEAMKMRNALAAIGNGVVKKITHKAGDSVEGGEVLVELE